MIAIYISHLQNMFDIKKPGNQQIGSANFFCEWLDINILVIAGLWPLSPVMQLRSFRNCHRQCVNEGRWLYANKILFAETDSGQTGWSLPSPSLDR